MALLYKYEQDPTNEEYHYRKALNADRHYSPALNNYGTLLYGRGEYKEALKHFKKAANDPSYEGRGSAWENMGRCYQRLGNSEDARSAYVKALRLNPRSVQPSLALAQLYFDEGRSRLAWDYYQQYVQRTGRQSARALWLGIQLSNSLGYRNQQSSYELALDNLYRRSGEYRQWQQWKAEQAKGAQQ